MKEIVKAESDLFWAIPLAMFYFDLLWKEPPLKKIEKKMQVIIKYYQRIISESEDMQTYMFKQKACAYSCACCLILVPQCSCYFRNLGSDLHNGVLIFIYMKKN